MYISHRAHRAGARPAATHNTAASHTTNSEPVGHAGHRSMHAPAQGGQREGEAKPRRKKKGEEGKPHPRTGRGKTANQGGREDARDSHTTTKARTHSSKAGKFPKQARPRATPGKPTKGTPRNQPAWPDDAQQKKADQHCPAGTDRLEERPPRTGRLRPSRGGGGPPIKRMQTQHSPPGEKQ